MVSYESVEQAAKKLAEEEFFNAKFMTVAIGNGTELVVTVFKRIMTDNLPQMFEGYKVTYKYQVPR